MSNVPTGPGWWWIRFDGGKDEVVELDSLDPVVYRTQDETAYSIDDDRIEWLDPVPMPGRSS